MGAPVELRIHLRCTWCRDRLAREEGVFCAECLAPHHPECRAAHGSCAAPGCGSAHLLRADAQARWHGRAARIAAGLALGLLAAAIGGWTAAQVGARLDGDEPTGAISDVGARVRARSSETEADPETEEAETETERTVYSWELTRIRLVTEGFAQAFELAPGDRLVFRSWAGSREVLRVPRSGSAELILVAPGTAAIEVRPRLGQGEAYATVRAEETCSIQIEVGECSVRIMRGTGPEALRLATQR